MTQWFCDGRLRIPNIADFQNVLEGTRYFTDFINKNINKVTIVDAD